MPSTGLFFISCNLNTSISKNITHQIINISMFIIREVQSGIEEIYMINSSIVKIKSIESNKCFSIFVYDCMYRMTAPEYQK